jgi:hypothetical protein
MVYPILHVLWTHGGSQATGLQAFFESFIELAEWSFSLLEEEIADEYNE